MRAHNYLFQSILKVFVIIIFDLIYILPNRPRPMLWLKTIFEKETRVMSYTTVVYVCINLFCNMKRPILEDVFNTPFFFRLVVLT